MANSKEEQYLLWTITETIGILRSCVCSKTVKRVGSISNRRLKGRTDSLGFPEEQDPLCIQRTAQLSDNFIRQSRGE